MRILVNALSARWSGGVTYFVSLLNALALHDPENEYSVVLSSRYQNHLVALVPSRFQIIPVKLPANPLIWRWMFQQFVFPRLLAKRAFHILFNVSDIAPLRVPCPTVVMVQDFTIYSRLTARSHLGDRAWFYWRQFFRRPLAYFALHEARRVVFGTETIRNAVTEMMKLPEEKTRVVYLGVNPIYNLEDREKSISKGESFQKDMSPPYFLVVSTVLPYKDLSTAISAFALFSRSHAGENINLIIVGEILDKSHHQTLLQQAEKEGISKQVRFLGSIPFSRLPELFQNSRALIFPSLLESFGLPLVEAMASGTPVIASDIATSVEVCGNAAIFFRMNDASELAKKISMIWESPSLAQSCREKGLLRSKAFSWGTAAMDIIQIFYEAAGHETGGLK